MRLSLCAWRLSPRALTRMRRASYIVARFPASFTHVHCTELCRFFLLLRLRSSVSASASGLGSASSTAAASSALLSSRLLLCSRLVFCSALVSPSVLLSSRLPFRSRLPALNLSLVACNHNICICMYKYNYSLSSDYDEWLMRILTQLWISSFDEM